MAKKLTDKKVKERLIEFWGEELGNLMYEYERKFKEGFPSIPLCGNPDEAIKIIKDCISKGEDVYDVGYLSLDVLY